MTFVVDEQADTSGLLKQAEALLADCSDPVANAANWQPNQVSICQTVLWSSSPRLSMGGTPGGVW